MESKLLKAIVRLISKLKCKCKSDCCSCESDCNNTKNNEDEADSKMEETEKKEDDSGILGK